MIYPPQCMLCDAETVEPFALCASCWGDIPFIDGVVCHKCGLPMPYMPGDTGPTCAICDSCRTMPRPWRDGRAVFLYENLGRSLILALKHGDRTDHARAVAPWLSKAAKPLLQAQSLLVPIPLSRSRLLKRKYNQAALLCHYLAKEMELTTAPLALRRIRRTRPMENKTRQERFAEQSGSIGAHPIHGDELRGRHVILVDDVMTSGATFSAATKACVDFGAQSVDVLALARVDPGSYVLASNTGNERYEYG